MAMKVGIIGLARSGKTTVFDVLTGGHAETGGYGGKREAHLGVIKVPDERLDKLAEIFKPDKVNHTELSFVDVARTDLAHEERALDQNVMNALRNADALAHVVRAFEAPAVLHPRGSVDPLRDAKDMETELVITDLAIVEKRLATMDKEHQGGLEHIVLEKCKAHLDEEKPLRTLEMTAQQEHEIAGFQFLSRKPQVALINIGEESMGKDNLGPLEEVAGQASVGVLEMCGKVEMEVAELPDDEQREFLDAMGIAEPARDRFIRLVYDTMHLVSFFTVVGSEMRAWTVTAGTNAVAAAGHVHTDMERGFIRAEAVSYSDFIECGGTMAAAKEAGKLHVHGKDYVVQDGDIIHFRFNV
jgi:GTP-binding protein YchF